MIYVSSCAKDFGIELVITFAVIAGMIVAALMVDIVSAFIRILLKKDVRYVSAYYRITVDATQVAGRTVTVTFDAEPKKSFTADIFYMQGYCILAYKPKGKLIDRDMRENAFKISANSVDYRPKVTDKLSYDALKPDEILALKTGGLKYKYGIELFLTKVLVNNL